jgi:HTH-type transcriptional regulator / antitoxin HigA
MLSTIKNGGKSIAEPRRRRIDPRKYGQLLLKHIPAIIETEAENRRLIKIIDELMRKKDDRTPEETSLLRLLAHLVDDFERRFYAIPEAEPREVLRELMRVNQLKQVDMVTIFGTKSVISEVLSGKRQISKAQAKALAKRFSVSTDVFL